jgi:hypothetical protein
LRLAVFRVAALRVAVFRVAVFRVAALRAVVFRALVVFFRLDDVVRPPDELFRDDPDDDEEPPDDFVSPDCARCLLTVRAAISFARPVERPCFFSESLMCSY